MRSVQSRSFIAFEGPVAVGKTTLATLLAEHLDGVLLLEEFERNEFLPDFYEDQDRWALAMQLWFLADREEQVLNFGKRDDRAVVADYSFAKNEVLGDELIRVDRERHLYQRLHRLLRRTSRLPDLVVYLDAPNELLLERIRSRGRPYEARIDAVYLNRLRRAYDSTFARMEGLSLIKCQTESLELGKEASVSMFLGKIVTALCSTAPSQGPKP
jgi:deoxyguanosine kinase